jgi:hypothetical protein
MAALAGLLAISAAWAQEACPVIAPIARLESAPIYLDRQGSVPDKQVEQANERGVAGLRSLYEAMGRAADGRDPAGCARQLERAWAKADALMAKPATGAGDVERVMAAVALNGLAVRARAGGAPVDPEVTAWLGRLTAKVRAAYSRDSLAGTPYYRNNVFFWSGVAQGLHAAASGDASFRASSDQVWRDAMERIDADGYVAPELARAGRSLIYHQFALSALLVLRATREALGLPIPERDEERLSRLADTIGRGLCDSSEFDRRSVSKTPQEKPGEWGARVASVFGEDMLGADWRRCGVWPKGLVDIKLGGDLVKLRDALAAARR